MKAEIFRCDGLNLRAMYPRACVMSHDCVPNTRHVFPMEGDGASKYNIRVYATRDIGERTSFMSFP